MLTQQQIFDRLKTHIFHNLYNYSEVTLRNNIKLTPLNNGQAIFGYLSNNIVTTSAPDNTQWWYLFKVKNQHLSNLLRVYTGWKNLEILLNDHQVNTDIVTVDKRIIPNRITYCKASSCGHTLIAIPASFYQKFEVLDRTTYLVIYKDTDAVNDRILVSHIPGVHPNYNEVVSKFQAADPAQVLAFVDGRYVKSEIFLQVATATNMLEVYIDENVSFSFSVDLTERNVYFSEQEQLYKDLVIIPRELVNGRVFTYDTFTVIVRGKDGRGLYLPFLAEMSVSTLTHTAFSLSSYLIDGALDKLGVSEGELFIQVCNYTKNNTLVANGNLTEELYLQDDQFLLACLRSEVVPPIPYWGGSRLESSQYSNVMTSMKSVNSFSQEALRNQLEVVGYYPTVKLLARHNDSQVSLGSSVTELILTIPPFWRDDDVYPILYLDGRKISHFLYTTDRVGDKVRVEFDEPLPIASPDHSVLQHHWVKTKRQRTYRTVAGSTTQTFQVPKHPGNLQVFRKSDEVSIPAVDQILTIGYEILELVNNDWYTVVEEDDFVVFQFKSHAYSHEFVFCWDDQVIYNVQPNVTLGSGNTLTITPTTRVVGTADEIPVLTPANFEVYLNQRFLVPGVDWWVKSLVTTGNQNVVAGHQIVVQNLSYLKHDTTDRIDVYQTSQVVHRRDVGYIVDGIIPRNDVNEAYITGLTRLFVNGRLVPDSKIIRHDTHYEIDPAYYSNGNVYCFEFGIMRDVHQVLSDVADPEYFEARTQINQNFTSGYTPTYNEPVIVPFPHRVYSSYLSEVIKRILSGEIEVRFINNDADILGQLAPYEYLKEFDLFFINRDQLDLRFSDVYPGYLATVTTTDLNHYKFIRRLVRIILGPDKLHDGMVVYTGL